MTQHFRLFLAAWCFAGVLGLGAAEATEKVFFATDFTESPFPWKPMGAGLVEAVQAAGQAEGSKALKLHFKFDAPSKGWPQVRCGLKTPFTPEGEFIVEFNAMVNHPGNYVPLKFDLIPMGCYEGRMQLPFIDEGVWRRVAIRLKARPGKEGTPVKVILFAVGKGNQNAGDETIFTIADLKIRPVQP